MYKNSSVSRLLLTALLLVLMSGGPLYADEAESIFITNCAECHGSEGYGTEVAPSLHNIEFLASCDSETIYYFIKSGATGYKKRFPKSEYPSEMPGYEKDLSKKEIKLLTTMIKKWNR